VIIVLRIDVHMCAATVLPAPLALDRSATLTAVTVHTSAWHTRDGQIVNEQPSRCLDYSVTVERLGQTTRVGRDLVTRPGRWLLRPSPWPSGTVAELRFDLPRGIQVSAPYPTTPDRHTFLVDGSLTRRLAHVALGRLDSSRFVLAGADFEVVTLDAPHRATPAGIDAWVRAAARAATELYQSFPADRVQVIVRPVPSTNRPVVFGLTTRGGGAGLMLLLAANAEDDELRGEWVAVHEMLHLGLPWTRDSEAWLQEGFVTYYQEVVRARAGLFSAVEGWQRLHDGFERGRPSGTGRSLVDESAHMDRTGAYRRVYWAGAALALTLDLEVRRRSNGERSLDDLMRLWHRRFADDHVHYTGLDLMRAADAWLGGDQCVAVCHAALAHSRMPDLGPIYADLGLRIEDGRVELTDCPDTTHRDAIMAPRVQASSH